jgi:hypothetical protein
MPNLFVVGTRANLDELAPSLLKARLSAGARASALDAIRRANPSLDLDDIAAGTVVVVPAVEGVRPAADDPAASFADDLVDSVARGVELAAGVADAAEERRVAEKKEVQALLGTAAVARLAESVPELAANIESVRAAFRDDDKAAKQQLAAMKAAQEVWKEDLATLRGLL